MKSSGKKLLLTKESLKKVELQRAAGGSLWQYYYSGACGGWIASASLPRSFSVGDSWGGY